MVNIDNSAGSVHHHIANTNKAEPQQTEELLTPKSKHKIIADVAAKKTESSAT